MKMTKRRWSAGAASTIVVAGAAWALMPKPVQVDIAQVSRGPLEVSIVDDGMTRIRERYEVAAPVTGRLLRIEVHPGDEVGPDTPLARIEAAPLDPKQEAQLAGRLHSAERAASEAQTLLRRDDESPRNRAVHERRHMEGVCNSGWPREHPDRCHRRDERQRSRDQKRPAAG